MCDIRTTRQVAARRVLLIGGLLVLLPLRISVTIPLHPLSFEESCLSGRQKAQLLGRTVAPWIAVLDNLRQSFYGGRPFDIIAVLVGT